MTHEWKKTLIFVVVAVLLMGAALVNIPDRTGKDAEFSDLGQKFFPDFTDPIACTTLEVVDVDSETAVVTPFKVQFRDGKWTIPSHSDYPADGKDRLAKTATGVMGLTKDTLRSDRVEDQEALGVVDPLDSKATSIKGRGERVTLKDASDKVLADFILGKEVKDRPGQRYVRVPGQKRIYGVNVKVDISARFADWIETNLLKLDVGRVRKVAFDSTKVEIVNGRGRLVPGSVQTVERKDAAAPWTLDGGPLPAGKELDTDKLSALTTALGDVKIVDVQRKPEGLTRELQASGDVKELTSRAAWLSLIKRGFYPDEQGRLVSNQGGVVVSTEDGAVYTLRFGEAAVAGGEFAPEARADAAKKDPAKKDDKAGVDSRYLMVTIGFDPKLLPPLPDPDAGRPLTLPDDVWHYDPGTPQRIAQDKAAQEKADRRKADEAKRVAEAEKKVKDLSDRFAAWYYLTPESAFKSLALDRAALIRDPQPKPPGGPGGFPGGGFPGMPPGGLGRPGNPHGD